MTAQVRARLSTMLFLEYFIWGAWYVTVTTWLTATVHLSGKRVGLIAGATAVGAMIAPFFVGMVADKFFATQKVLAVLHLAGAGLLLLASFQTSFGPIYAVILAYCLCFMPTLALTNSLSFRQMRDPKQEFGSIRVLGTAGWIVAGLAIGFLKLESTAYPLQIAAAASLVMGLYCFTLPDTPPLAPESRVTFASVFPRQAFSFLGERSMIVFVAASFLICIPLQFYYAFTNPFLNEIGVKFAAAKMSGGQMSELVGMLLIPWFFRRLGVRYMLAAGMAAWVIRYAFFAYGNAGERVWMLWAGILLHGICYDFFFVTGQIYIDRKAPASLRAAAQSLITFITYGVGMFTGSWLSGAIVEHYTVAAAAPASAHDWRSVWLVAAVASLAVLIVFLFTFFDRKPQVPSASEAKSAQPVEAPL